MEQMAVLQSIINHPEKPISLGPHQGEDLVDLLLRLIPLSSGSLKQAQTVCLMCYQDERVTRFLVEEFALCKDPALVLRLAGRIVLERDIEFFRPFLWGPKPAQSLAAARLCSQLTDLTPVERLRVALLLDREFEPPELQEQNLDLWLRELAGQHRIRVRQLAGKWPERALLLWTRWPDLAIREQEWLIALTARHNPKFLKVKLAELLESTEVSAFVVTRAVEQGLRLPANLLAHQNPVVRAAAIFQGHADDRLEWYLGPEASILESLAALDRCHCGKLVDLLGDTRWQIRGAAANRLCQLDNPPIKEIRLQSESPHLGTKVAALKVLERLTQG